MKTVVFVWSQKFCNLNLTPPEGTFGLGDMLRGTVGALRYCADRGYECIIDISLHPIAQLLIHKPHRYSKVIQDNENNIKFLGLTDTIREIDAEFEGKDLIYFFSNFGLNIMDTPANQYIKQKIHEILTPTEYLASYIASIKIPRTFGILHFRVGDKCVVLEEDIDGYDKYINFIKSVDTSNMILMSDSSTLKQLTKDIIFSLEGPTAHIGFHKDAELLKHTLAEFMILQQANIIITHSVYGWPSGFVKLISYIYDIKLIQIGI